MNRIYSRAFWKAAFARSVHTVAESAVALVPATAVTLGGVQWAVVASGAVLAGVLSALKSIAVGVPEVADADA